MAFERMTENVMNISGLPNVVVGQASMLKNTFDKSGKDMKTFINNFLDVLESQIASQSIGASVETVPEKTVQAILTAFESEILNRYTKSETDTLVSTDTNNLIEDFDINLTTGVITITKKDGTTETFDTAIEKVPAKFEIVESGSSVFLKITNVDGTSTQTDITELMNVYEFNNSDDIAFTMTGTGNEKKVTANIRNNSIGIEKFSLSVISQFEGYVTSASNSANEAKGYAQEAETSKEQAASSATQATNQANNAQSSATSANNSANTATTKANEASTSASLASSKAKTAESYAHGGTGTRDGEDTDNAKYYAQIAKEVAGGDFVTPTEMEAYAQPLGTTPTYETTELSGQEIEVDAPLAMESVIQLSGNSEQDSRSGKNKLKKGSSYVTSTSKGIEFTVNEDESVTLNGTNDGTGNSALYLWQSAENPLHFPAGTYKSKQIDITGLTLIGYTGSKYITLSSKSVNQITLDSDTDFQSIYLQVSKGTTETFNNLTIYPIVVADTDSLEPYEPYGVQPSPEFESPIRSVKGKSDNLFDINGDVNAKFDGATSNTNTVTGNDLTTTHNQGTAHGYGQRIYVGKGNTVTFSAKLKSVVDKGYTGTSSVAELNCYNENDASSRVTLGFALQDVGNVKSQKIIAQTDYIILAFGAYTTERVTSATFTDIMVNKGDKALPYQPYGYVPVEVKVEGKSLYDYKDRIQSISGLTNVINADGTVTTTGKPTASYASIIPALNITDLLEDGEIYTVAQSTAVTQDIYIQISLKRADNGIVEYINTKKTKGKSVTFVVDKTTYQRYDINVQIGTDVTTNRNFTSGYMLLKGSYTDDTLPDFEPYKEPNIVSLPLGDIELRSTPYGTRDTFVRVDGVWNKVEKARAFSIPNNSTYWNSEAENEYGMILFNNKELYKENPSKAYSLYCNNFITADVFVSVKNYEVSFSGGTRYPYHYYIVIKANRLDGVTYDLTTLEGRRQALNKWLTDNPTEIVYALATPTYTPITDQVLISVLDELEQLILHKGYNKITATAVNGVKAYLDLTIPSTASVTEVVETESSLDMPVLLAAGEGDVKPKIAKDKQMTFNATTGEAKVNGEKVATIQNLLAVIPTTGWSGTSPYYTDIAVQGLKATDKPHYGLSYSTVGVTTEDKTARENEQLAFNDITTMIANDNSLRVICDNRVPLTQITIQLEVIR